MRPVSNVTPTNCSEVVEIIEFGSKVTKTVFDRHFPTIKTMKTKMHPFIFVEEKVSRVYLFTSSSHFDPDEKNFHPDPNLSSSWGMDPPPPLETLFLLYIF